jgi:uncharacterized protein (TIGR03545 family)
MKAVRWNALFPLGFLLALIVLYFVLFFDAHLRWAIQTGLASVNRAEVNVAGVRVLWSSPGLVITGIQVTNPERPTHNRFSLSSVELELLWDALLRAKLVVREATAEGLILDGPRSKTGWVAPPGPASAEDSAQSLQDRAWAAGEESLRRIETEHQGDLLGQLARLLGGANVDTQIQDLSNSLQTPQRISEVSSQFSELDNAWQSKLKALPNAETLKAWENEIKSIQFDRFESPDQIQNSLTRLDKLNETVRKSREGIDRISVDIRRDLSSFSDQVRSIETSLASDIQGLAQKLKLPALDVQSISQTLFGRDVVSEVRRARSLIQRYRPDSTRPKGPSAEDDEAGASPDFWSEPPKPIARAKGVTYQFGRRLSYPAIWLQKARLSSVASPDQPDAANATGEISNLSSDFWGLGRPVRAEIKGDVPGQGRTGLLAVVELSPNTSRDDLSLTSKLSAAKWPTPGRSLLASQEGSIELSPGDFSFGVQMVADSKSVDLQISATSKSARVTFGDQKPTATDRGRSELRALIESAVRGVQQIDLSAKAQGQWSDLRLNVTSSLGRQLADGFTGQIQRRVAEERKKLELQVRNLVDQKRQELNQRISITRDRVMSEIKMAESRVDEYRQQIEQRKNQLVNERKQQLQRAVSDKIQEAGKDKLDQMRKGLGF